MKMKRIEFGDHWVRIEDGEVFGLGADTAKRLFAMRIFSLPEIESAVIEPASGFALIRYQLKPNNQDSFRQRLILAITGKQGELDDQQLPIWSTNERVVLHRWNNSVSTLRIAQKDRYRLTLQHPAFKKDAKKTAYRVKQALETLPGVATVSVSPFNGAIHVRYSADIEPLVIVRKAEARIFPNRLSHPLPQHQAVRFSAANVNMLLCTAGQFMFPAMIPVASGVLIISRYDQLREAAAGLIRGKVNVPAFQSVVLACSVATGAPLASALGEWFSCYWQRRWRKKVAVETQELLDEALPIAARAVLLDSSGHESLVPVSGLNPGDRIRVGASELIPVDGKVLSGEALVSEAAIHGIPGVKRKRPFDDVFNSSVVTSGSLIVEVRHTLAQTESARLADSIVGMTAHLPTDRDLKQRELRMAQRSVLPNLAIAGVGVMAGGLHTASAILHQDWISGPCITLPTQSFQDMREALQYGALVNSATALSRLAETDVLVIDGDSDKLMAPRMELKSVHTDLKDTDTLLALCASVSMCLGDARAEALMRVCSERGLMLSEPDSVTVESGGAHVVIDGHKFSLLDQENSIDHALLLQVDGIAVAKLAFGFSAIPRAAEPIAALKHPGLRVVVISSKSDAEARSISLQLGADLSSGNMGDAERVRFLQRLKLVGHKPAYLGTRGMNQELVKEAHVSMSMGGVFEDCGSIDIFILSESVDPLTRLMELGRQQEPQVGAACRKAVLPNLLCIAGAFTGVLNGATSTLLANLGVSNIDNRQGKMLSRPTVLRKNASFPPTVAGSSYCYRLFESGIEQYTTQSNWMSVYTNDTA